MSRKSSYVWGLFLAMLGFVGMATTTFPILSLLLVMLGLVLILVGPSWDKKTSRKHQQNTSPAG